MPWIIELVTAHSGHAGPQSLTSGQLLWSLAHPPPGSCLGIWWLWPQPKVSPVHSQPPPDSRAQTSSELQAALHTPLLVWARRRSRVYNRAIKITAHIYLVLRIHCYHWSIPHNHQETRTPHKGNPCSFYPNQDPGTRKGLRIDRERGKGWKTIILTFFVFVPDTWKSG